MTPFCRSKLLNVTTPGELINTSAGAIRITPDAGAGAGRAIGDQGGYASQGAVGTLTNGEGSIQMPGDTDDFISFFMGTYRVTAATKAKYASNIVLWKEFHHDMLGGSKDYLLKSVADDDIKAKIWTLFITWLYLLHGKREEEVGGVLSAVRDFLLVGTQGNIKFLNEILVREARKCCKRNTAEQRAHAIKKGDNVFLPMCEAAVDDIFRTYYTDSQWDWDGTLKKVTAVAIALGLNIGLRVSNLTLAESNREDHCIRCSDVSFEVEGHNGTTSFISAGDVATRDLVPQKVVSLQVHVYTDKTGEVMGAKVAKTVTRGDPHSSRLIDAMLDVVQHSGVKAGDELFTVYRASAARTSTYRKVLRRSDVSKAIKAGCESQGLPAKHFSTCSMRKTFATTSTLQGASSQSSNDRANWATNARGISRTRARHYDHSSVLGAATGSDGNEAGQGLTTQQILRMVPGAR